MGGLFDSGRVVDLLLLFMVVEGISLWAYGRSTGRGVRTFGLFASLAAGGCILLALRAALTESGWEQICLWLIAALFAHIADLLSRWRR